MNITQAVFQNLITRQEFEDFNGGYLGHSNRTETNDKRLLKAAIDLGLSMDQLYLWANSRNARHAMDNGSLSTTEFRRCLQNDLPDLEEEQKRGR